MTMSQVVFNECKLESGTKLKYHMISCERICVSFTCQVPILRRPSVIGILHRAACNLLMLTQREG